jgi:hypothetical protein
MVWEDFVKLNPNTRYENEIFENRLRVFDKRVPRGILNLRAGRRQEIGYNFIVISFQVLVFTNIINVTIIR